MTSIKHTHADVDRLTFGCSACVAVAEQARIDNAPIHPVTWVCSYLDPDGNERTLSFTRSVKVPVGWTPDQVDELHVDLTGEAFVMALPDDIPMDATTWAMETMEVKQVTIGTAEQPAVVADHVQEQLL